MPHRFAFIVIDMLADFFDRQPALALQRQALVTRINELARQFRQAGEPVVWVRQEFRQDLSDAFLDMRREDVRVTIAGTRGCMLLPELEQRAEDHVIVKKRYSALFGTPLDALLATWGSPTLVVAGINTHACVRMTVIDAYQRDHDIILASDCIGSYDEEHHDVTIRYLDGRMARLLSSVEIMAVITGS